jgi:hypothetical protein
MTIVADLSKQVSTVAGKEFTRINITRTPVSPASNGGSRDV